MDWALQGILMWLLAALVGAGIGAYLLQLRTKPKLLALNRRLSSIEQDLGSTQTKLRISDSKRIDFERELALEKQQLSKLSEQSAAEIDRLQTELAALKQQMADSEARAEHSVQALGKDLEAARAQGRKAREEQQLAEASRREAVQASEVARSSLQAAQRGQDELRGLLAGATADKDQRQRQIERLEHEIRDWQQKFAALGAQIKPRIAEAETAQREREAAHSELRRAQVEIKDLREALRQARNGGAPKNDEAIADLEAKVLAYGLDRSARGAEIERLQAELKALQAQLLRAT